MPDQPDNTGDPQGEPEEKVYWCDVCRRTFDSKRCPQCGLKLKRVG